MPARKSAPDAMPAKAADKRVFDVAKPGEMSPASATSKPVIVTNRPIIQDPMVTPAAESNDPSPNRTKILIQPLASDDASPRIIITAPEIKEAEAPQTDEAPKADATPQPPEPEPEVAKPAEDKPVDPPEPASSAAATGAPTPDNPEASAADAETARLVADAKTQEELDKLVDSKQFFLPIRTSEQRRSRLVLIFGVVVALLLIAAWLNIALDAGFIDLPGIKPLTDIF